MTTLCTAEEVRDMAQMPEAPRPKPDSQMSAVAKTIVSCADHNIAWRIRQALKLDRLAFSPDHNDAIGRTTRLLSPRAWSHWFVISAASRECDL